MIDFLIGLGLLVNSGCAALNFCVGNVWMAIMNSAICGAMVYLWIYNYLRRKKDKNFIDSWTTTLKSKREE